MNDKLDLEDIVDLRRHKSNNRLYQNESASYSNWVFVEDMRTLMLHERKKNDSETISLDSTYIDGRLHSEII